MRHRDLRTAGWIGAGLLALAAVAAWQGFSRRQAAPAPPAATLLDRAMGFLQCPRCSHTPLTGPVRDRELVCPACNARYPYDSGVLDMMGDRDDAVQTVSQKLFQRPALVAAYDHLRTSPVARLFTGRSFREEADQLLDRLQAQDGKPVLDVACGPANFTSVLAGHLPHSLVFGLDISRAQLRRGRRNLQRAGIQNVLLVCGDAERLPFRDEVFRHVSNCGGLHQLPHLKRAVAEIGRVLRPGGFFAGLALVDSKAKGGRRLLQHLLPAGAVQFVDLDRLGQLLHDFGLKGYGYEGSRWIGYFWARKTEPDHMESAQIG